MTTPEEKAINARKHPPETIVSRFVRDRFGAMITGEPDVVTLGTSIVQIVPSNPNRVQLVLINNSDSTMYFHFVRDVSPNNGILLNPNGGSCKMKVEDDGEMMQMAWFGLSTAATKYMTVLESSVVGE